MKRLRLGWWWLLDYLYAGRRQLLSLARRSIPRSYAKGDAAKPAIVLLPGVYESWHFLEPAAAMLNARGFRVFTVPQLGINNKPVPLSAGVAAATLAALHADHGVDRCVLLAHSKGGLIGKHVMLDAASPVDILGLVALCTPFSGSQYARYLPSPTLRHFSPDDAVLVGLAGQTSLNAQVVSIYPEFDPHIPGGSALSGATNIELPVAGHFRTLGTKVALAAVERAVARLT